MQISSSLLKVKILIVDEVFPSKTRDSGSLDSAILLESLMKLNYEVSFLSLSFSSDISNYQKDMADAGVDICASNQIKLIGEWLLKHNNFDIIIISRVNVAVKCFDFLKYKFPRSKFIFNTVDIHHIRERREAILKKDNELLKKSEITKQHEINCVMKFDTTIVINKTELNYLLEIAPKSNIIYLPMARDYPTDPPKFSERRNILFVGSFAWQPNIDGLIDFLNETWPLVMKIDEKIRLSVIGYRMPDQLKLLSKYNIDGLGFVENITPYINTHRLSIAPLRFGAGTKGKVIQSITHGLPVIGSTISGEGLVDQKCGIVVTDDRFIFSQLIVHFHNNINAWDYLHDQCLTKRSTYSINNYQLQLNKIIDMTIREI